MWMIDSEIDEALERLKQNTYGICEECELDIAEERLKALPFTRLCVTCQADQEKEAKQVRRTEEDRGYRRFAVGESDGAAIRLARVLRARTGPGTSRS